MEFFKKYPLLFPNGVVRSGVWVERGWLNLIEELASKIEEINHRLEKPIVCVQIKEKFGDLCFYVEGIPLGHGESVRFLIEEYRWKASKTCEFCGAPSRGKQCISNLWKTCCENCMIKLQDERMSNSVQSIKTVLK